MKEHYQKEISQIHVPAELLEKTKQAMKEAEAKLEEEKNTANSFAEEKTAEKNLSDSKQGKIVPFARISMVAVAAVLLLVAAPAATNLLKNNNSEVEQDMQLHLSGPNEIELQQIKPEEESTEDKNWLEKLVDKIEELFE